MTTKSPTSLPARTSRARSSKPRYTYSRRKALDPGRRARKRSGAEQRRLGMAWAHRQKKAITLGDGIRDGVRYILVVMPRCCATMGSFFVRPHSLPPPRPPPDRTTVFLMRPWQ